MSIWCGYIAWAIEWAEVFVRRFAIARREFIDKVLRSDAIDCNSEVAIGNGRISCFDTPQWFTQITNLNFTFFL